MNFSTGPGDELVEVLVCLASCLVPSERGIIAACPNHDILRGKVFEMSRALTLALLLLLVPAILIADDKADGQKEADAASDGIAQFEGDANDADALRKYAGEIFGDIAGLLQKGDVDQAESKLNALEEFANGLELENDEAKTTKERITQAVEFFGDRIELARISIDDLQKQLEEEPTGKAVQQYIRKLGQSLSSLASSDPKCISSVTGITIASAA